ncbi:hypothetical protein G5B39_08360 [Rhodobacteraceae bacterium SC52]|nr:hypothetical protein G5B39_08360 [Rhodobacteraceae bacterium SC52]
MTDQSISGRNNALARHLGEKLDVPGETLDTVLRRAGREIPRRLRGEARYLVEAETMAQHPKLYHMVDKARMKRADRALRGAVRGRDPKQERKDRMLGTLAGIAFGLVVFFAVLIWFLAWRGMIGPGT